MARLTWGDVASRFYEIGVDRGVLYPPSGPGVAWNGLVSVEEAPDSSETKQYFQDGIMYIQVPSLEEYRATITSMQRPKEFAACDGVATGLNGLTFTQQRRQPFGFSYRTFVGNTASGDFLAYRLHLVYNAIAGPSQRSYVSMGGSADNAAYSWPVTACPPAMDAYRPTPHIVIESLDTPAELMTAIEDILYGTAEVAPRLPTPQEIFDLGFGITVTDNGDGTFTISGPDEFVYLTDPDEWEVISPNAIFLDADTYTISST